MVIADTAIYPFINMTITGRFLIVTITDRVHDIIYVKILRQEKREE